MGAVNSAADKLTGYIGGLVRGPSVPKMPGPAAPAPEMQDEAIRNAKLAERRRQLGLAGRQSTWLTGARGDTSTADVGTKTLLGG